MANDRSSLNQFSVTAVIPTYNGLSLLKKNLGSVLTSLRNEDELIIVDDASTDETVNWLKQEYSLENFKYGLEGKYSQGKKKIKIKVVLNIKNLRFAASVNKGVQVAENNLIFLLNNDVKPKPNVLDQLLPHFKEEQVFGVGCLEKESNQTGGKNKLWFERGLFVHARADNFNLGETAWVSGGSGLFDKDKWQELGGFDLSFYPAYWEDIDLSFRAKKKGWSVIFENKSEVEHLHETTNKSVFGEWQISLFSFKNGLKFFWKHASFGQKIQHFLWLPYHLVITNLRTKGAFLMGYLLLIIGK